VHGTTFDHTEGGAHKPSSARKKADGILAARIRIACKDATLSHSAKAAIAAAAVQDAARFQHQQSASATLRLEQSAASTRANASAALVLSSTAVNAVSVTSAAPLFDGGRDNNRTGKSKIYKALNPQPIARQTIGERKAQEENPIKLGTIGYAGEGDGDEGGQDANGFGSDSDLDFTASDDSDDDAFDDTDLAIDPTTAAQLEANRTKRAIDESDRAKQLGAQHAEAEAVLRYDRAEEMVVIEARQQLERTASQTQEGRLITASHARMATELSFDTQFFEAADADGDGMVSLAEALAKGMSVEQFKLIDADNNGTLSPEEVKAWTRNGAPRPPSMKSRKFSSRHAKEGAFMVA
jgi:hypothetical protein